MPEWSVVLQLISEIEQKAQRSEDRGLEHGTVTDIVSAQMALGCKRGMSELRQKISWYIETEKRILESKQSASTRSSRKPTSQRSTDNVVRIPPLESTG